METPPDQLVARGVEVEKFLLQLSRKFIYLLFYKYLKDLNTKNKTTYVLIKTKLIFVSNIIFVITYAQQSKRHDKENRFCTKKKTSNLLIRISLCILMPLH